MLVAGDTSTFDDALENISDTLMAIFNPKDTDVTEKITLPLYYTGLIDTASIRQEEGKASNYKISREYKVELDVPVKANSYTWLVVE